jgi:hypothetical protein
MNPKKTILWLLLAIILLASIYFYHPNTHSTALGPDKVLPELRAAAVTSILIRPSGPVQLQIRADRTNGSWQLSQPLDYPAQAEKVDKLLAFLEQLKPAPYLTASELHNHSNADEEYGFAAPQATLVIQQGAYLPRIRVGALTNPGDQVFLQVEGDLGAYVVDAELLKYLPHSATDWRDTSLANLTAMAFDRIAVTNNSKGDATHPGLPASSSTFVLQRESTNRLWRMAWPLDARANHSRIDTALEKLQGLRIREFVSDDPKADLEPLGLLPPELELGFANGTNIVNLVQFGRCPTNDLSRVYGRRTGRTGIFTVDKELLLAWCAFLNDFRDPHLLGFAGAVDSVELLRGEEHALLQWQPDNAWKVLPDDFAADTGLMTSLLANLTNLEVIKFVNDVVNPADLPEYGLAPPLCRMVIKSDSSASVGVASNLTAVEVAFGVGTNLYDNVFAKRSDETFVYAISTNDFARLPTTGWQLRDRALCHFPVSDVGGITLRLHGKISQLIHKGPLSWAFAAGSQGIINDAAIEETIRGVVQISAIVWVARGEQSRAAYGFTDDGYHLRLALRSGANFDLEFGGQAPSGNVYAAVVLEGQPWILEFPWMLFRDIASYLPMSLER